MNRAGLITSGIFCLGIALGSALGFGGSRLIPEHLIGITRVNEGNFQYINPLIECENVSFENADNLTGLKKDVVQLEDNAVALGQITEAAIYYRDLNNGPWFGINKDATFSPASLVKVPVLIAFLKRAEVQPGFLAQSILIEDEPRYAELNYPPTRKLVKGENYSYQELLERMIIDSDNVAYELLANTIGQDAINEVYRNLGIDIDRILDSDLKYNIITVQEYASFFRILFNATYLDHQSSEAALSMLAKTTFSDGIFAGVAANTPVAHKFGERIFSFSGVFQLHDCGIVYSNNKPYLLCIMTKGYDFSQLEKFLQSVSRTIDSAHTSN